MRILTAFLLAFALLLPVEEAMAQSYKHRPVTLPSHNKMVHMHQEMLDTGQLSSYTVIAPLGVSSSGFGIDKAAVKLSYLPVSGPGTIPAPNPVSKSAALSISKSWMQANAPALASRIASWLKSQGISNAIYTYMQEVYVTSDSEAPRKQAITFNMSVDNKGRPLYGDPKLVDPDPRIAEVIYVPLNPAGGLPEDWVYPDAGSIKYRVLDKKLNPLTEWTIVDVGGAFDDDDANTASGDEDALDEDSKLKCLVDLRNPGCSGPLDVVQIMDKAGAAFALLDYIRRVQPDYEEVPDADTDGYGDAELVARMAISVDSRVYDCKNYYNDGYYGFVLALQGEKYLVSPQEPVYAYQLLQKFGALTLSPVEPYSLTVSIQSLNYHPTLKGHHPDNIILSPFESEGMGWLRTNHTMMKRVIYLAPVTAKGDDGLLDDAYFSGDMAVSLLADSGNVRDYYIGTVGDNYWGTGLYDRSISFNLEKPDLMEEMSITQMGYDDHMLVSVNGAMVFNGPNGGDMLDIAGHDYGGPCPAGSVIYLSSRLSYINKPEADDDSDGDSEKKPPVLTPDEFLASKLVPGYGCAPLEYSFDNGSSQYMNLKPLLRDGTNVISMRVAVGGLGEGWVRIRIKTCGSPLDLFVEEPPIPPDDASEEGVGNDLRDQIGTGSDG